MLEFCATQTGLVGQITQPIPSLYNVVEEAVVSTNLPTCVSVPHILCYNISHTLS